jgi:hypothetical protein
MHRQIRKIIKTRGPLRARRATLPDDQARPADLKDDPQLNLGAGRLPDSLQRPCPDTATSWATTFVDGARFLWPDGADWWHRNPGRQVRGLRRETQQACRAV